MFVGVLVDEGCHTDVLFGKLVLDGGGNFLGVIRAVGSDPHEERIVLIQRDFQSLQPFAIHEEESQIHKLRWRHKWMADQAGDGQASLLVVDLEDDLVALPHLEKLSCHALDADIIFLWPVSLAQLHQLIGLVIEVGAHMNHARPPIVLRVELVEDAHRVIRFDIFDSGHLPQVD